MERSELLRQGTDTPKGDYGIVSSHEQKLESEHDAMPIHSGRSEDENAKWLSFVQKHCRSLVIVDLIANSSRSPLLLFLTFAFVLSGSLTFFVMLLMSEPDRTLTSQFLVSPPSSSSLGGVLDPFSVLVQRADNSVVEKASVKVTFSPLSVFPLNYPAVGNYEQFSYSVDCGLASVIPTHSHSFLVLCDTAKFSEEEKNKEHSEEEKESPALFSGTEVYTDSDGVATFDSLRLFLGLGITYTAVVTVEPLNDEDTPPPPLRFLISFASIVSSVKILEPSPPLVVKLGETVIEVRAEVRFPNAAGFNDSIQRGVPLILPLNTDPNNVYNEIAEFKTPLGRVEGGFCAGNDSTALCTVNVSGQTKVIAASSEFIKIGMFFYGRIRPVHNQLAFSIIKVISDVSKIVIFAPSVAVSRQKLSVSVRLLNADGQPVVGLKVYASAQRLSNTSSVSMSGVTELCSKFLLGNVSEESDTLGSASFNNLEFSSFGTPGRYVLLFVVGPTQASSLILIDREITVGCVQAAQGKVPIYNVSCPPRAVTFFVSLNGPDCIPAVGKTAYLELQNPHSPTFMVQANFTSSDTTGTIYLTGLDVYMYDKSHYKRGPLPLFNVVVEGEVVGQIVPERSSCLKKFPSQSDTTSTKKMTGCSLHPSLSLHGQINRRTNEEVNVYVGALAVTVKPLGDFPSSTSSIRLQCEWNGWYAQWDVFDNVLEFPFVGQYVSTAYPVLTTLSCFYKSTNPDVRQIALCPQEPVFLTFWSRPIISSASALVNINSPFSWNLTAPLTNISNGFIKQVLNTSRDWNPSTPLYLQNLRCLKRPYWWGIPSESIGWTLAMDYFFWLKSLCNVKQHDDNTHSFNLTCPMYQNQIDWAAASGCPIILAVNNIPLETSQVNFTSTTAISDDVLVPTSVDFFFDLYECNNPIHPLDCALNFFLQTPTSYTPFMLALHPTDTPVNETNFCYSPQADLSTCFAIILKVEYDDNSDLYYDDSSSNGVYWTDKDGSFNASLAVAGAVDLNQFDWSISILVGGKLTYSQRVQDRPKLENFLSYIMQNDDLTSFEMVSSLPVAVETESYFDVSWSLGYVYFELPITVFAYRCTSQTNPPVEVPCYQQGQTASFLSDLSQDPDIINGLYPIGVLGTSDFFSAGLYFPSATPNGAYTVSIIFPGAQFTQILGTIIVQSSALRTCTLSNCQSGGNIAQFPSPVELSVPINLSVSVICNGVRTNNVPVRVKIQSSSRNCFGPLCGWVQPESDLAISDSDGVATFHVVPISCLASTSASFVFSLYDTSFVDSAVRGALYTGTVGSQSLFSNMGAVSEVFELANAALAGSPIEQLTTVPFTLVTSVKTIEIIGPEIAWKATSCVLNETVTSCALENSITLHLTLHQGSPRSYPRVFPFLFSTTQLDPMSSDCLTCVGCRNGVVAGPAGIVSFSNFTIKPPAAGRYYFVFVSQGVQSDESSELEVVTQEESQLEEGKHHAEVAAIVLLLFSLPLLWSNTAHSHTFSLIYGVFWSSGFLLFMFQQIFFPKAGSVMKENLSTMFKTNQLFQVHVIVLIFATLAVSCGIAVLALNKVKIRSRLAAMLDGQDNAVRALQYSYWLLHWRKNKSKLRYAHEVRHEANEEFVHTIQHRIFYPIANKIGPQHHAHQYRDVTLPYVVRENLAAGIVGESESVNELTLEEKLPDVPHLLPSYPHRLYVASAFAFALVLLLMMGTVYLIQYAAKWIQIVKLYVDRAQVGNYDVASQNIYIQEILVKSCEMVIRSIPEAHLEFLRQLYPFILKLNLASVFSNVILGVNAISQYLQIISVISICGGAASCILSLVWIFHRTAKVQTAFRRGEMKGVEVELSEADEYVGFQSIAFFITFFTGTIVTAVLCIFVLCSYKYHAAVWGAITGGVVVVFGGIAIGETVVSYIVKWTCTIEDRTMYYPRLYTVFSAFKGLLGFFGAIFLMLLRVIKMFLTSGFFFAALSERLFPVIRLPLFERMSTDAGHGSYLAMVGVDHVCNNPVMLSFLGFLEAASYVRHGSPPKPKNGQTGAGAEKKEELQEKSSDFRGENIVSIRLRDFGDPTALPSLRNVVRAVLGYQLGIISPIRVREDRGWKELIQRIIGVRLFSEWVPIDSSEPMQISRFHLLSGSHPHSTHPKFPIVQRR